MTIEAVAVGVAQFEPSTDFDSNIDRVAQLARHAATSGTKLLIFPELAMSGWGANADAIEALAEPLDGHLVTSLTAIADDTGVVIVAGLYEISDNSDRRPFNTLVAVAPGRGVVATHRKAHLYDAWGYLESNEVQPGEGALATFEVQGVRVGLLNCYEVRFPERSFALVEAGCEVLAVSAAWARGPHKEEHWTINIRSRAIENTVWVAAASLTGPDVIGRSLIVDPLGVERAALDEASEQWVAIETTSERTAHAQRVLPIREQRKAFYH